MRKLAVGAHILAMISVLAINGALVYLFADSCQGSYLQGTLRTTVAGYYIPALGLEAAIIVGLAVILLNGARLIQLCTNGRRFAAWPGLRMAGNTLLVLLFLLLVAAGRENHIFTYLYRQVFPSNEKPAPIALRSDAELGFPTLPISDESKSLDSLAFTGMDGSTLKLGDLKGKSVFLNVWATWCPPCKAELPNIERLYEQMKSEPDVAVILVTNESSEVVKPFLDKNPHAAPIYLTTDDVLRKLKVQSFPTTFFIAKTGEFVFTQTGAVAWDAGTTREFLLALARDLPFAPFRKAVEKIALENGVSFEDFVLVPDSGAMDLAPAPDGALYYADYFQNSVGVVDRTAGRMQPLLENLNAPKSIAVSGEWLYFTEVGTKSGQYKDGTLARMKLPSGPRETVAASLSYPNSVFVTPDGSVYVTEAPGGCTSFGGTDRLIVFKGGSNTPEEVFKTAPAPESAIVDADGNIFIGEMGSSSPGDSGRIRKYAPGDTKGEVIVSSLPAVQDMVMDGAGNLFVAGNSSSNAGVVMVAKGQGKFVSVKTCGMVTGLGIDASGNIYYSPRSRVAALMRSENAMK